MTDLVKIKVNLHEACLQLVGDRIVQLEKSLEDIRESRDHETKSSVGDKYETGRAMLQIEADNYQRQLDQTLQLKQHLELIDPAKKSSSVQIGSLVSTNQYQYFVSVGLGEVQLDNEKYFCISAVSPIGQKIINQSVGYKFIFNNVETKILEIC